MCPISVQIRYFGGKRRHAEQLQLVSHENNQVGRNHHRLKRQLRVRLRLSKSGAQVRAVPRRVRGGLLGRGPRQLPAILQDQLQSAVPPGQMLRSQTQGVLSLVLRRRLCWTKTKRLPRKCNFLFQDFLQLLKN